MILLVLQWFGIAVVFAWQAAALALRIGRALRIDIDAGLVRGMFHELRPFYLPAVAFEVILLAADPRTPGWVTAVDAALMVGMWFVLRNEDDDDRWKRRRRKAAEKVAALGGRLVVVTAGGAR